jgi:hypothetical protein
MLAIMMGNAGGAWDNSKKLCEKLNIKKTDQGKACVVGDTVGDPFKDTSGPSLDILLKLMAMVSLLIAPLIDGNDDWENWWVGAIVALVGLILTAVLLQQKILTWADPLGNQGDGDSSKAKEAPPQGKAGTFGVVPSPAVKEDVEDWSKEAEPEPAINEERPLSAGQQLPGSVEEVR